MYGVSYVSVNENFVTNYFKDLGQYHCLDLNYSEKKSKGYTYSYNYSQSEVSIKTFEKNIDSVKVTE